MLKPAAIRNKALVPRVECPRSSWRHDAAAEELPPQRPRVPAVVPGGGMAYGGDDAEVKDADG